MVVSSDNGTALPARMAGLSATRSGPATGAGLGLLDALTDNGREFSIATAADYR